MEGKPAAPLEALFQVLDRAARRMREEIGKRLRGARSALGELVIEPPYRKVLESAPEELVALVNASA